MFDRHPTSRRRPARSAGLVTVLTVALSLSAGLSACGSSNGSSGSSAPTTTGDSNSSIGGAATTVSHAPDDSGATTTSEASTGSSETTTSDGASGSVGTGPKEIKACEILPKADAITLSGLPLTKAVQGANDGGQLNPANTCTYVNDDQSKFFSLTISQRRSKASMLADPSDKTVAGLGDAAYFSDAGGLDILSGSTEIDVLHLPEADATKVAKAVLAKLGG